MCGALSSGPAQHTYNTYPQPNPHYCTPLHTQGDRIYTALHYDNAARSELRSKLRLRSSVRGANNLMDIQQIVTFDREDGTAHPLPLGDAELDGGGEGVERRESRRGLTPYKLVTWDKIATTELNLPVSQLDYYLPG